VVLSALQTAEKSGENFDAVPEILETEIFVRGVLIVVVVRDGEGDHGDVAKGGDFAAGKRWVW
jgi:hypothetical protein